MVNFRTLSLFVHPTSPHFPFDFQHFMTCKVFLPHHLLSRIDFCKLQLSLTLNLLLYLQLSLSLSFFLLIALLNCFKFCLLFKPHFLQSFKLKFGIIDLHLLHSFSFFFGLFKEHLSFLFFFLHFLISLHFKL